MLQVVGGPVQGGAVTVDGEAVVNGAQVAVMGHPVPVDKGDARNLTRSADAADRAPVWSPDGASVAWFSAFLSRYPRSFVLISHDREFLDGVCSHVVHLHDGRAKAIRRMAIKPGDQILEVGVGTGISLPLYSRDMRITGVDLSEAMLDKARDRVSESSLDNIDVNRTNVCSLNGLRNVAAE